MHYLIRLVHLNFAFFAITAARAAAATACHIISVSIVVAAVVMAFIVIYCQKCQLHNREHI